jgi:hypothetical protein
MEPPCGIGKNGINVVRFCILDCVVENCGRVTPGLVLDDFDAEALCMDIDLFQGAGTERISRSDDHRKAVLF